MNRPQRNHNPLNLMIRAPIGEATGVDFPEDRKDLGYAVFPSPMAGWRAAHRQIKTDQRRGLTLRRFIFKFAPPQENDTNEYLEFVCENLGCRPDVVLRTLSVYALAGVMAAWEGYYAD